MNFKTSQKVLYILQTLGLLLIAAYFALVGKHPETATIFGLAALVVLLADAAQVYKYFRCPRCGKNLYFHGRGSLPADCPNCGLELFPSADSKEDKAE